MFAGLALLHTYLHVAALIALTMTQTGHPITPVEVKCRHTVQSDYAYGEEDNLYMCMPALSQYSTWQPAAKQRMQGHPGHCGNQVLHVLQTLERSYLLRVNGTVVERPQHMLMRVSVGMHQTDIESAIQTYHLLSERWFTHASPTLFNAGTPRPQLSSCFLICMKSDSIEVRCLSC